MNYRGLDRFARILLTASVALALSACSDEDVDQLCVSPLSTGGSPDITAKVSYTDAADVAITTAAPGDPIKVLVPVDSETRSVILGFAAVGSAAIIGSTVHVDTADRIVDGTPETVTINYTAPAAGSYYPVLVLCSDTVAEVTATPTLCSPAGRQSVGYLEDTSDVVTTINYARVIVTDPTPAAPVFTDPAVDSTAARNSCVEIASLVVQ